MYLIFDTETTGLPQDYNAPITDLDNWPRLVQLAWQLHDENGELVEVKNFIVKPDGFTIPFNSEKIHGISTERAQKQGVDLAFALEEFNKALAQTKFNVGHNIEFDINIMGAEFLRAGIDSPIMDIEPLDTKNESTDYCAIPGGKGGKFKWPTLTELHTKLFGEGFGEAHNASADVEATARCFFELVRLDVVGAERLHTSPDILNAFRAKHPTPIEPIGLDTQPYEALHSETESVLEEVEEKRDEIDLSDTDLDEVKFTHLHNHTQFSVLQSTSEIGAIIGKAIDDGMKAVSITDHGNMYGVFKFVRQALAKDLKPIVGCELNVAQDHANKTLKDNGYHQVFLAKNKKGYHNLAKLSSFAFTEGFYYVPRIDKKLVEQYKENLIALSGSMRGEIPHLILNVGEKQAEEAFVWWYEQFGEDFYVEIVRHGLEEEARVNEVLIRFAKKYGVRLVAANDVYYVEKEDANAHDILLCVKDGEKQSTPIGRGRDYRFGFPNDEYYFKSQNEMKELFKDIPEAIENVQAVVDKIESYELDRDVLLPAFDIPAEFETEDDYLRHLTYEGAKKRYEEITDEIRERLDFELETIKKTGYPGYFLIVQDFTAQARKMGVSVGPGRGSAAGSAVAYCIGITNVDPIAYDLLFERFLNPDRVSLPDIDIDFDDEGRGKIIDWVVDKYGKNQVAQIITYGSMAAKSAIRDTARALDLPLFDADRIAKLVPDTSLDKVFNLDEKTLKSKLNADQLVQANELKEIARGDDLQGQTVNQAVILEGSIRNTGIHACGVIITPSDIRELIPVTTAKDAELLVTQYDNSVVEDAGMLKMDFLGLKTLSIIKDAIAIIKDKHGVEIDPDTIPLDDVKTYELYQRGETNGTFQFESPGMQKHLKNLKPDKFADLIAMNALYRPGPLEYIPNFIARKHGREEITYDIPAMEEYLAETYGITVYQEQVMLLSQKLAGFSKGDADVLRKAMGKKIFALLQKLKPKFLDGCKENGHDVEVAEKVWKDWEAFAAYAFNKSHSTCYSVVAFHTAYLKAHYPAEYMASVLTHNMNDIKKVTFFMEECKRMGLKVLGPDVNESVYKFTVNDKGEIRFGLGGMKGVGGNAVEAIVAERTEGGKYTSIFDLTCRVDLSAVNKKTLENLALGGGFDCFENEHRALYFDKEEDGRTFLEKAVKYGHAHTASLNSAQASLFGETSDAEIPEPAIPFVEPWGKLDELAKEKEVNGIYISGHPLDDYKLEIQNFCNCRLDELNDLERNVGRDISIAGIITSVEHRTTKTGKPFGKFVLEDYSDSYEFALFSEDYLKLRHFLIQDNFLYAKAKVQKRSWGDGVEIKFSVMQLLQEVMDNMAKSLLITTSIDKVTEDFVSKITDIVSTHKGKQRLKFKIVDHEEQVSIEMPSSKLKVNINKELFDILDGIEEVTYKLN